MTAKGGREYELYNLYYNAGLFPQFVTRDNEVCVRFSAQSLTVDGIDYSRDFHNSAWGGYLFNIKPTHECMCSPYDNNPFTCGDYMHSNPNKRFITWEGRDIPIEEDLSHLPSPA